MATEEDDLFNAATMTDDQFEETVEATPTEPEVIPAKPEAEPPTAQQAQEQPPPAPEQGQPPPAPHQVPLSELLTTRERAQAAERERDEARKAFETLQRQLQAEQQRQYAAQQQQPLDPLADPEGWQNRVFSTFEQRLAEIKLDSDLRIAEVKHGETFGKAYEAFLGAVGQGQNPALYHHIMRSSSPGEAMVDWYRREETIKAVGTDPTSYRSRLAEELLNDPAFVAKVIEKTKSSAPQGTVRPSNVTRLPPSLSRATSAAAAHTPNDDDDDGSEDAIWEAARDKRGRFISPG